MEKRRCGGHKRVKRRASPPWCCAAVGAQAAGGDCGQACGGGLLASLGLPDGAVRNVIMALDIVPRAFACDYTLVADILKRVSPSFRDHPCLSGGRRVVRCPPCPAAALSGPSSM